METIARRVLTLKEAAVFMGITQNFAQKLAKMQVIPAFRYTENGNWYIYDKDLKDYIENKRYMRHSGEASA